MKRPIRREPLVPAAKPVVPFQEPEDEVYDEDTDDIELISTGTSMMVPAFTLDSLKECLPKNFHSTVTNKLLDDVNNLVQDDEFAAMYRENLVTFQTVLLNGKYTIDNYLDAVSFCSFKFMGMTDKAAYENAFPSRVKRLRDMGKNDKTISAYVCAYAKGKLVVDLLGQASIPNHLLYRDVFHKAIMKQAKLMNTASSELVQTQAANSLLNALKQPDVAKMQINATISNETTTAIESLAQATAALVRQQRESIINGTSSAKELAEARIVDAEYVE